MSIDLNWSRALKGIGSRLKRIFTKSPSVFRVIGWVGILILYMVSFLNCFLVAKESLLIQKWSTIKLFSLKKNSSAMYLSICQNQWVFPRLLTRPSPSAHCWQGDAQKAAAGRKSGFFKSWFLRTGRAIVSLNKTVFGNPNTWKGLHKERKEDRYWQGLHPFLEPVSVIVDVNVLLFCKVRPHTNLHASC